MYNSKDELFKELYRRLEDQTDMTDISEDEFVEVVKDGLRDYLLIPAALILE